MDIIDLLARQQQRPASARLGGVGAAAAYGVAPIRLCQLFRRFAQNAPHPLVVRLRVDEVADRIAPAAAFPPLQSRALVVKSRRE
jgi:hypothetical protein